MTPQRANLMRSSKHDVIYTPLPVALKMIELCGITEDMKVLDPCRGGGVFYDNLPPCDKHYCEITEGIDFFEETKKYDVIIGNPPFSMWTKWLEHTCKLTDKFCYIFGALNLNAKRINAMEDAGFGLTKIHLVTISWWFSHQWICVFERNKPSIMTAHPTRIHCDICDGRCGRGLKGVSPNECTKQKK